MIVKLELGGEVRWTARESAESGRWIAECESLNLAMEADSLDELHSLSNEAMQLLLDDLYRDGELEAFLEARGWRALDMPNRLEDDEIDFDFPWNFTFPRAGDGPERRAG